MFLLDTNVISELRKPRPHGAVVAWVENTDETDLHIPAIAVGEIQAGIEITREQDPAKAAEIEAWLEQIIATGSVVDMDARAFRCWARLMHRRSDDLIEDAMVAATAIVNNLVVATRNARDFASFGVRTFNPFDIRP